MKKYSKDLDSDRLFTYVVEVNIRAKNRKHAQQLVGWAFDNMMSFEDKGVFKPKVVS